MQRTEAVEAASYPSASRQVARAMGTATKRIAGVTCLATTNVDEPYLNRAIGFGTIAEATPALLERIERFYASLNKPIRVTVPQGFVPASALRVLEKSGYRLANQDPWSVYIYDDRRPPPITVVPGLTIERAGPKTATIYARTSFESFSERGPGFVDIVEALLRSPRRGLRAYLGRIDGEPAATGMLFDARPVGGLGNGSVVPAFRGRGLQKALISHRIRDGWARGYRLFFGQTQNPVSAHNMESLGWRKLYDEQDYEKRV
jgi:GNAT superfamily N-acetyltransferase